MANAGFDRTGRPLSGPLIRAFYEARGTGEFDRIERAAIDLTSSQHFGAHPGPVPALVHEAYAAAATSLSRCRLAAALARAWAYGGEADRAVSESILGHQRGLPRR